MQVIIDAENQPLGRLASKISLILQGKDEPNYEKHKPGEKTVIVKNALLVKFTGKKFNQKIYRRHTGYIAHLKEEQLKNLFKKNPREVIKKAVYGMLPKNKLRDKRIKRLKIEL